MPDFTIIVPSRGAALGLWATTHSCDNDFEGTDLTYNYVIVTNGDPIDADTKNLLYYLGESGKLLQHIHSDAPLSPPVARQRGAAVADGHILCFFDNHCLVGKRYFERVAADFAERPIDMLHSATRFYSGFSTQYHYRLLLDFNFWASSESEPLKEYTPYQIAAGGHGGFAVRKSVWEQGGGYGPEGLFIGYAGEELTTDLTLWRKGFRNWLDPRLIHYHFAGERGYSRHYSDEYYTNLMVSALVVGGEKWLYKVYDSFAGKNKHLRVLSKNTMYDLMERAYHRAAQYAKQVDASSTRTLDELLVHFREQRVAF